MKLNKRSLFVAAAGIALSAMLSGCASEVDPQSPVVNESTGEASGEIVKATNIQLADLNDYKSSISKVIIFDIERDGETLTCSTKESFRAGVSCFVKSPR